MLKHVVGVLQTHPGCDEPLVRLGGDEFVWTLAGISIENARERFEQIVAELDCTPDERSRGRSPS